jgi:predicted nucleic acid-binding protein
VILIDTVIWADHLGKPDPRLIELLDKHQVYMHPHIIGELALGNLRQHDLVIRYLQRLPQLRPALDSEVLVMISRHKLSGCGIGYSDAHLLASLLLTPGTLLWTRDKRFNVVAHRFGLGWTAA